jgi:hypothetical protein
VMEGSNEPPAKRSGARLDEAHASAGFENPFTLSKEECGVGKRVEDVQQYDRRSRLIAERQRERRADDVDVRSRSEVDRDDGGSDLVIETASGPHLQDDSARRRSRDGGLVVIVVA